MSVVALVSQVLVSQSLVQLRASGGLRAFNPGPSPLYSLDWILFVSLVYSFSYEQRETFFSDLTYQAADPHRICVDT